MFAARVSELEPCMLSATPSCAMRRTARRRLNADVIELPGGHSPFLSRPDDLATLLHDRA